MSTSPAIGFLSHLEDTERLYTIDLGSDDMNKGFVIIKENSLNHNTSDKITNQSISKKFADITGYQSFSKTEPNFQNQKNHNNLQKLLILPDLIVPCITEPKMAPPKVMELTSTFTNPSPSPMAIPALQVLPRKSGYGLSIFSPKAIVAKALSFLHLGRSKSLKRRHSTDYDDLAPISKRKKLQDGASSNMKRLPSFQENPSKPKSDRLNSRLQKLATKLNAKIQSTNLHMNSRKLNLNSSIAIKLSREKSNNVRDEYQRNSSPGTTSAELTDLFSRPIQSSESKHTSVSLKPRLPKLWKSSLKRIMEQSESNSSDQSPYFQTRNYRHNLRLSLGIEDSDSPSTRWTALFKRGTIRPLSTQTLPH